MRWVIFFLISYFANAKHLQLFDGFRAQVLHDVLLAAWRVVAHVVFEHLAERCVGRNADRFKAHVFVDELSEFFRADFAETFESSDFETGLADFLGGLVAFGFVVAVFGHLLVAHAEKRRLQDVQVLLFY